MNNILVATDFSNASINAGKYAVELAKQFKAKLFLFNAYHPPAEIPESYIFFTIAQVGQEVMQRLEIEEKIINKDGAVFIEKVADQGVSSETILTEAIRRNVDLIICGIKGSGKTIKRLFGSITTGLAQNTTIPLIIVPEQASFKKAESIVFASDMKTHLSEDKMKVLKDVVSQFNSNLSVVTVVDGSATIDSRQSGVLLDQLKAMQPCRKILHGSDTLSILEGYMEDNSVDMIVMVPHAHGLFYRLFSGSVTAKMSFISKVPLLILPEKGT